MRIAEILASAYGRATACAAAVAGGVAAAALVKNPLAIGVASTLAGAGSSVLANDFHQAFIKRLSNPADLLLNHDLRRATAQAISVCIHATSDALRKTNPADARQLRQLASFLPEQWEQIERWPSWQKAASSISESEISGLFAVDTHSFRTQTTMEEDAWHGILNDVRVIKRLRISDMALRQAARKIHETFASAFLDVVKYDFNHNGEAFAALHLQMMSEILGAVRQTTEGHSAVTPELQKAIRQDLGKVTSHIKRHFESIYERCNHELVSRHAILIHSVEDALKTLTQIESRFDSLDQKIDQLKELFCAPELLAERLKRHIRDRASLDISAAKSSGKSAEEISLLSLNEDAALRGVDEVIEIIQRGLKGKPDDTFATASRIVATDGADSAIAFIQKQEPKILAEARAASSRQPPLQEEQWGMLETLLLQVDLHKTRWEFGRSWEILWTVFEIAPEWHRVHEHIDKFLNQSLLEEFERHDVVAVARDVCNSICNEALDARHARTAPSFLLAATWCRCLSTRRFEGVNSPVTLLLGRHLCPDLLGDTLVKFSGDLRLSNALEEKTDWAELAAGHLIVDSDTGGFQCVVDPYLKNQTSRYSWLRDVSDKLERGCVMSARDGHVEVYSRGELRLWYDRFRWRSHPFRRLDQHLREYAAYQENGETALSGNFVHDVVGIVASLMDSQASAILAFVCCDADDFESTALSEALSNTRPSLSADAVRVPTANKAALSSLLRLEGIHVFCGTELVRLAKRLNSAEYARGSGRLATAAAAEKLKSPGFVVKVGSSGELLILPGLQMDPDQ